MQIRRLTNLGPAFTDLVEYTGITYKIKVDAFSLFFPGYFQLEDTPRILSLLETYWKETENGREGLCFHVNSVIAVLGLKLGKEIPKHKNTSQGLLLWTLWFHMRFHQQSNKP